MVTCVNQKYGVIGWLLPVYKKLWLFIYLFIYMDSKRANSWQSFSFLFACVEYCDTSPAWRPDVLITCGV